MSSVLDVAQQRSAPVEPRPRSRISITQKRWLLSAHLVCLGAWLGGGLGSLALNLRALGTTDPHLLNAIYIFADLLHKTIIRGGAGGSLITGLSLALLTQWGPFRYYWVIAKEGLSLLGVSVDLILIAWNTRVLDLITAQGPAAFSNSAYLAQRSLLLGGSLLQLSLLAVVIGISIFKPWGARNKRRPGPA